jgi:regulator of Ty1 transposition protein 109
LSDATPTTTPRKLFPSKDNSSPTVDTSTKPSSSKRELAREKTKNKKKKLSGVIIPRLPRIKTAQRNYLLDRPAHTAYYSWDPSGRGERVVREDDYRRMVELLLHLDFATLDKAAHSTRRWVTEVGAGSGSSWGRTVRGTREPQVAVQTEANVRGQQQQQQQVNNLTGLVKRKRTDSSTAAAEVNILGARLVRKKPKAMEEKAAEPEVNVLGQGLVGKNPKP